MMIAIPVLAVTITQQMLHHSRNEFNTIDSLRNLHYGKNIFSIKFNLKIIFFSKNWITPHACALCLKYLGWIKFGLAAVGSNLFSLSLSLSFRSDSISSSGASCCLVLCWYLVRTNRHTIHIDPIERIQHSVINKTKLLLCHVVVLIYLIGLHKLQSKQIK